nr:putative ribonuclease H-like domain-containing protein [Tanacetum cinerariifolium]
ESEVNVSPSSSAQSRKQDDKTKKEAKRKSHVESFTGYKDLSAEFEDCSDNSINEVNDTGTIVLTIGKNSLNNTNTFNAVGPSNAAASPIYGKSSFIDASQLLNDPDMPELEDITYFDDEEDVGAVTDFNNLETSITVSHIPITRVHKDHHVSQIIEEPKMVHQALKDPSWIEAMQEELLQNKKDERVIVVRNKARLVAQGHTQEEGIDYKEVFAPIARIEAIRLFLAYASFMGFMLYQMDVKSAFLYRTVEEEVYVCQPLGFEDPDHPDKVYKVVKALYGLHQAPKAWYENLANYLLENGFQRGEIDQTLFIKKQKGDILLVQIYVDDIIFGATNKDLCKSFEKLMKDKFRMSSMGELTFFLGLQVKQKKDGIFISQDKYVAEILRKFRLTKGKLASTPIDTEKPLRKDPDVKRIFRYLKGKPHLDLWYPNDSPFDLVAYSDSDYDGASLDKKSITRGCQFLGCRLISWQCKKQIVVATSSTEAEYVAAASCYAQVLWIQNQLLDYGTRVVQETLHVNFMENNPNITGSGPTWLLDIDSLTRTMNYQLVTTGNQTNPSAGFQDKFDAEKAGEEFDQQYVLFPVWSFGYTNPQNYDGDAAFEGKEHDFDAKKPESEVNVSPSSSAQSRKQDDKTQAWTKNLQLEDVNSLDAN